MATPVIRLNWNCSSTRSECRSLTAIMHCCLQGAQQISAVHFLARVNICTQLNDKFYFKTDLFECAIFGIFLILSWDSDCFSVLDYQKV